MVPLASNLPKRNDSYQRSFTIRPINSAANIENNTIFVPLNLAWTMASPAEQKCLTG